MPNKAKLNRAALTVSGKFLLWGVWTRWKHQTLIWALHVANALFKAIHQAGGKNLTKTKWYNVKMAKYTLQTFFIARNKKHTTACTYIQNTNYRQTDVEHVVMFISIKTTWSKKDHTLTIQHSVIEGCCHS